MYDALLSSNVSSGTKDTTTTSKSGNNAAGSNTTNSNPSSSQRTSSSFTMDSPLTTEDPIMRSLNASLSSDMTGTLASSTYQDKPRVSSKRSHSNLTSERFHNEIPVKLPAGDIGVCEEMCKQYIQGYIKHSQESNNFQNCENLCKRYIRKILAEEGLIADNVAEVATEVKPKEITLQDVLQNLVEMKNILCEIKNGLGEEKLKNIEGKSFCVNVNGTCLPGTIRRPMPPPPHVVTGIPNKRGQRYKLFAPLRIPGCDIENINCNNKAYNTNPCNQLPYNNDQTGVCCHGGNIQLGNVLQGGNVIQGRNVMQGRGRNKGGLSEAGYVQEGFLERGQMQGGCYMPGVNIQNDSRPGSRKQNGPIQGNHMQSDPIQGNHTKREILQRGNNQQYPNNSYSGNTSTSKSLSSNPSICVSENPCSLPSYTNFHSNENLCSQSCGQTCYCDLYEEIKPIPKNPPRSLTGASSVMSERLTFNENPLAQGLTSAVCTSQRTNINPIENTCNGNNGCGNITPNQYLSHNFNPCCINSSTKPCGYGTDLIAFPIPPGVSTQCGGNFAVNLVDNTPCCAETQTRHASNKVIFSNEIKVYGKPCDPCNNNFNVVPLGNYNENINDEDEV